MFMLFYQKSISGEKKVRVRSIFFMHACELRCKISSTELDFY